MELVLIYLFVSSFLEGISGESGHFWHVTDHHYDPSYTNSQNSCFQKQDPEVLGYYGDFLCDPPWSLVNDSIYFMKETKPDPDFIIWTGDSTPHTPHHTIEDLKEIVRNITNLLEDAFPGVRKFITPGNHDFVPVHLSPPHNDSYYEWLAEIWAPWLNHADNITTFHKGAYYTGLVNLGIRVVVLNTNLYNSKNTVIDEAMHDPADQLAWFDDIMTKAARDNEAVHVVGHVPPGCIEDGTAKWFYPEFNKKLNDAIIKHHSAIRGVYFGHQHYHDSFKVYMNENEVPISSFFLTPSVTPWTFFSSRVNGSGHNPAVRLFQYNKQNGKLNDYFQYYLNLPEANRIRKQGLGVPQWELEYQATKYFNIPDVTATSLGALSDKLKTEAEMIDKYLTIYVVNASTISCDATCRSSHVCAIQNPDFQMYERCYENAVTSEAVSIRTFFLMAALCSLINRL